MKLMLKYQQSERKEKGKEQIPEQYRHITNEEKCAMTSHRCGEITGRYVIYRGDSVEVEGIQYLNVEEYLKSL